MTYHWTLQKSGTMANLSSVVFVNNDKGWVVGEKGTILHSKDGGQTWVHQNSKTDADLFSVDFINEQIGWAAGSQKTFIHTRDGGRSWSVLSQKGGDSHIAACAPYENLLPFR